MSAADYHRRMSKQQVLIAGESWVTHSIHQKGFDSFTTTAYEEGVGPLRDALEAGGFEVTYLPNHIAATDFPDTAAALADYAAVILSDIGANTLLLHPETFARSVPRPDRIAAVRDYVRAGGGLLMVGGYLTFAGIEGKARWAGTPVEEALPVTISIGRRSCRVTGGRHAAGAPARSPHRGWAATGVAGPARLQPRRAQGGRRCRGRRRR